MWDPLKFSKSLSSHCRSRSPRQEGRLRGEAALHTSFRKERFSTVGRSPLLSWAAPLGVTIILLVQIAVAGPLPTLGSGASPTPFSGSRNSTCSGTQPTPKCGFTAPAAVSVAHDTTVTASNVTTLAGDTLTFTAHPPSGVVGQSFTWYFGDGDSQVTSGPAVTHNYSNPGIYLVYVVVNDSAGKLHDNLGSLFRITIRSSFANDLEGNIAEVQGVVVGNGTASASPAATVAPGGSLELGTWTTFAPFAPGWTLGGGEYVGSPDLNQYLTFSSTVGAPPSPVAVTATISSSTPAGSYYIEYEESSTNGSALVWSLFLYTVFVEPGAQAIPAPLPVSPHSGTLVIDAINGSSLGLDPAVSYDPTDDEVMLNVFQTLIVPNATQSGPNPDDFVPDLATCVPGSSQCLSMYGTSLAGSTGNYTFVIDPKASFYDPTTGQSYSVTPNDVAFSIARDCLGMSVNTTLAGGYVPCESILPSRNGPDAVNYSWDDGLHAAGSYAIGFPMNNTPSNILQGMTVNDSAFCTPQMMNGVGGSGCVTFHTSFSGQSWPEFLEFFAQPISSIVSCPWETASGNGLPGWESGGECLGAPPGAGSSLNPNPVPGPTAWDPAIANMSNYQNPPESAVRWSEIGSGPYAIQSYTPYVNFTLVANPAWGGTTCTGSIRQGCLPPASSPPTYIPKVEFNYYTSATAPFEQLTSGVADMVDLSSSTSPAQLLDAIQAGEISYTVTPAVTTWISPLNLNVSTKNASAIAGQPATAPSNLLQDINVRQFLIAAFPHGSVIQQDCSLDGLLYCFPDGGAIPDYMNGYYPQNLSWPTSNPDTNPSDVGGAAWWWTQVQKDGMVGSECTPAHNCSFVISGWSPYSTYSTGPAAPDLPLELWVAEIRDLSGGALDPIFVANTSALITQLDSPPGQSGSTSYFIGWDPDFFDPSDYVDSQYLPNTAFTYTDALYPTFVTSSSYQSPCAGPASDPVVTESCQGTAYNEMVSLIQTANTCTAPACSVSQRELLYNMAEHIAEELGLYVSDFQSTEIAAFANWIDGTTVNSAVATVGTQDMDSQALYDLRYVSAIPSGYPLSVSPLGTSQPTDPASAALAPLDQPVSSPAPRAGTRSAAVGPSLTMEAGESIVFLIGVSGGSGVYHFTWNGLPSGCTTTDTAAFTCAPTGNGTYSVSVTVTDTLGDTATSNSVTVNVIPHVAIRAFTATPETLKLGNPVAFNITVDGGQPPYSTFYAGLPPGCASPSGFNLTCTPDSTGNYSVLALVTDAYGVKAFATQNVSVYGVTPPPPPGPTPNPFTDPWVLGAIVSGYLLVGIVILIFRKRRPPDAAAPRVPDK